MLRKLNHPKIVNFIGFHIAPKQTYIVMELMEYGDLKNFLHQHFIYYSLQNKTIPKTEKEKNIVKFFKVVRELMCMGNEIILGMQYLEHYGIVHRDLAARNILISMSDEKLILKISDFGLARLNNYALHSKSILSLDHYSPEALELEHYTHKSDVWSFGVTFWEILNTGEKPPTKFRKPLEDYIQKMNQDMVPDLKDSLSMIFNYIWIEDSNQRPNFNELQKFWSLLMKNIFLCSNNLIPFPTVLPSQPEEVINTDYGVANIEEDKSEE